MAASWRQRMATLKSTDILADIARDKPRRKPAEGRTPRSAEARPSIALPPADRIPDKAGLGKPSAYLADLREKLRDKVQLNLGGVPRFIREEFERLATEQGMGLREYFYYLLRQQGADIPPYQDMDGRKL